MKFIKDFQQKRNTNEDKNDLIIVNSSNNKEISLEIDQDYYSDSNSCLICKRNLHNVGALILHYKLVHLEYNVFHFVKINYKNQKNKNSFTDLKEAHIFLFLQKDFILENHCLEEKTFNFQSSNEINNKLSIEYLSIIDLQKLE